MKHLWPDLLLGALGLAVALFAARPYADGYNDGGRLATIEMLGERGTYAIDDSIFIRSKEDTPRKPNPYTSAYPNLEEHGTLDKVRIDGRFYSDKPPVPNLFFAGAYRVWLMFGGPTAAQRPDSFCYWCTVLSAGGPFLLGLIGIRRLMLALGHSPFWQILFALSFGFSTVAVVYTRHVNGHIQLLGVTAIICWLLARVPPVGRASSLPNQDGKLEARPTKSGDLLWLGGVTGLAYTIELGIGPLLLGGVLLCVFLVTRSPRATAIAFAATLPMVILHHAINYAIGNTLAPLGSVMAYLDYPGSAFGPENATGNWKHSSLGEFLYYGCGLLFSDRGFLTFHPTLWPAILLGIPLMLPRYGFRRWHAGFCFGWAVLSWFLYTATSNNYSGHCCTIRWFLPLLAPGYWMLGMLVKEDPRYRIDFLWLSAVGAAIVWPMFENGPWQDARVDDFWQTLTVGGIGWLAIWIRRVRGRRDL